MLRGYSDATPAQSLRSAARHRRVGRPTELGPEALSGCMRRLGGVSRGREGEGKQLPLCAVEADRTIHRLRRVIRPRNL